MESIKLIVCSSIGKKIIVALTGLILFGFTLVHMAGNLQIFLGREAINAYAFSLAKTPALVWAVRVILLISLILHVFFTIKLKKENAAARPVKYVYEKTWKATLASRWMIMSGLTVLSFLIYHILHFTLHWVNNTGQVLDEAGRHDVYKMMVEGFQTPMISAFYVLSMILLCWHLSHGVTSLFQTLGVNHPNYNRYFKKAGPLFAFIILVGNCSIPLSILLGVVK